MGGCVWEAVYGRLCMGGYVWEAVYGRLEGKTEKEQRSLVWKSRGAKF